MYANHQVHEEIKLDDTVDSQDVAELMLSILDEVKSWLPTESALAAEPPELIVPAMSVSPIAAAPTESALAAVHTESALAAAPTEDKDSTSEVSQEEIKYTGGRNKIRACPLCNFKGTHLSCHLKSQHLDKCMSSKDVTRFVAVSEQKLKVRGTAPATTTQPKATYLYQCGYRGCSSIVKRMGQHLKQAHHITDKNKMKEAKTKFIS